MDNPRDKCVSVEQIMSENRLASTLTQEDLQRHIQKANLSPDDKQAIIHAERARRLNLFNRKD